MRRPISLYSPSEGPSSFTDAQRSNSYRILKSHTGPVMSGQMAPRYLDHASSADANIYGGSMTPTSRMAPTQEPPCAYLNMEMQIAKSTSSFGETIGMQSILSRKFQEIVSPTDREKVVRLQRGFEEERREREPNYLPPIYLVKFEEDRVIQSIGFSPDELSQARTDRQEMFTFQAADGQQRTFQVRFGLAKKESTYFIVVFLNVPATPQAFQQPSSSPYSRESYSRDSQYGFQTSQQGYAQNSSMSPFAPAPSFGDPRSDMTAFRTPGPLGTNIPQSALGPQFIQTPARPEFPQGQIPYQTPRSELQPIAQRQQDLQLPPIRDQGQGPSVDSARRRDDRSGRVDIGGLLEKPDPRRTK